MRIDGLKALNATLKSMERSAEGSPVVEVGFTAGYAVFVHENLQARHPVGQAKFLEQPARENAKKYAETIRMAVRTGLPLARALVLAGLELQADAMRLTPVDTGALRASAFTRLVP
jgi:hypothetical protein